MLNGTKKALLLESGKLNGLKEKIMKDYSQFQFVECSEGYKAIDLISESSEQGKNFDLIILDFPPADLSRFEFISFLKTSSYGSDLMMVTGVNGKVHLEPFTLDSEYVDLVRRYQAAIQMDHLNDVLMGI